MDVSVHRPEQGGDTRNHHAHLLCTTRRLTAEGFQDKTRELDDLKTGEVLFWRERWAALTNDRLKDRGVEARVDHRTLEAQGIERAPTVHKGPLLTALERRGIEPQVVRRREEERAQEVQERLARAAELGQMESEQAKVTESILVLSTDIAAARRDRNRTGSPHSAEPTPQTAADNKPIALDQWREEARRETEAAKEKSTDRQPIRAMDKDRGGADYER